MPVDWLEMMQRLAAGARAKAAEDRRRLEELQAQRADARWRRSARFWSVSRPTLTIIAGANGAGKTTLTAGSPGMFAAIPLLDPDAFANTLRSNGAGISTIAAGKEVLRLARNASSGESFAVETTLSGKNSCK